MTWMFFFLCFLSCLTERTFAETIPVEKAPSQKESRGDTNVSKRDLTKEDAERAKIFIQDLGDKGIRTLTGKELSEAERRKKFEALFIVAFDYDRIGKFVLGRFRRGVVPDDMKEYLGLFKEMVVRVYAARFGEYNNEKFKVFSCAIVDQDVDTAIVSSQIIRPNNSKVSIEWHIYQNDGGELKIYDVVVEGVSMALTQRSEFSATLQQGGIKKLIADLKTKKSAPSEKRKRG